MFTKRSSHFKSVNHLAAVDIADKSTYKCQVGAFSSIAHARIHHALKIHGPSYGCKHPAMTIASCTARTWHSLNVTVFPGLTVSDGNYLSVRLFRVLPRADRLYKVGLCPHCNHSCSNLSASNLFRCLCHNSRSTQFSTRFTSAHGCV
jgi:hypothetical protein